MTRTTLGSALPLLALGFGVPACVVPIDLVEDTDAVGDTDSVGDGSGSAGGSADDGSSGDVPDCSLGELGCACSDDACEAGSVCAEGVCVPLVGPCGNGVLDEEAGEDCDDGNLTDADGCNADCRPSGSLLWTTGFDGARSAHVVEVDGDDAIVVGGTVNVPEYAGWIRKLDSTGAEQWLEELPVETTAETLAIHDDGRIVAGCSEWGGLGNFGKLWIRIYFGDGSVEEIVDGDGNAPVESVIDPAGVALMTSYRRVHAYDGDSQWFWSPDDNPRGITVLPSGNVVVGGNYDGGGSSVSWLAEYEGASSNDAATWSRPGPDGIITDLAVDGAGNIVALGSDSDPQVTWLHKLAPDGTELWTRTIGEEGAGDLGRRLAVDSHDRIVLAGHLQVGPGEDRWLVKTDPDGQVLWSIIVDGGRASDVAIDSRDEILVVGQVGEQAWLARYAP